LQPRKPAKKQYYPSQAAFVNLNMNLKVKYAIDCVNNHHHYQHQRLTSYEENATRKEPHSLPQRSSVGRFTVVKMTSGYVSLIIPIGRMPFLMPNFDNADSLFVLVTTSGFYQRWRIKTQLVAV